MKQSMNRAGSGRRRAAVFWLLALLLLGMSAGQVMADQTETAQASSGSAQTEAAQTSNGSAQTEAQEDLVTGGAWKKIGTKYAYILRNGVRAKGWQTIKGKTYYFNKKGYRVTGLQKIDGAYYFFSGKGVRRTGWRTVNGQKYYFDPAKDGARARGWTVIGKSTYYFKKTGLYRTGWLKSKGKYYYFKANGKMARGWLTINKSRYYFDKSTGERLTGSATIADQEYYFDSSGKLVKQGFTSDGRYLDAGGKVLYKSTIKQFLQIALQPVGSTMYVWGGGWNASDTGGNLASRTIGVSPRWKTFFEQQTSSYNYRNTRYQNEDGLDCAGYVGWVIYNAFNRTSGNAGYVMLAQNMAKTFAGYGWGSYTPASSVKDFKAGDIMSLSSGHVYIVLGQCKDGSVVLLHSSPQGVMISGTTTRGGNKNSTAIKLADKYMKAYYPKWYAKFPDTWRNVSYLTSYSQMRWYVGKKKSMMTDPDGYRSKNAQQILKDLFGA